VRRSHASRPAPTVVRSSVISKRVKRIKNPNAKLRRYRHNWTKDDEETLIDAEAVIRARCRGTNNRGRLAMVQIFPSIGDQVLRTKLKKLLEQPGREAYYRRLEDAFYHLWVEFRGSPELPDTNPMSHTDFDLKRHVEFLREKVNKNLLKLPVPSTTPSSKDRAPDLPLAPLEVATVYQWEYLKAINTTMDQLVESSTAAEDTRLHNVSLASIVTEDPRKHRGDIAPRSRMQGIVRGVLKMIVGTPTEIYSTVDASRVLSTPLEKHEPLIAALVNEQVLLKNISGSARQIPGRMYGFTTQWLQQSDNLLPMDLEVEVDAALARFDNPEQTTQWPLIGTGGDLAALMTMVSNHEAEFDIDLSNLPSLRTNRLQYNTRALSEFNGLTTALYIANNVQTTTPLSLTSP
jgi:transcription factor C subunit 3